MVDKGFSVTKGVTEDRLEEISTKGYGFYWHVATDGYEWYSKDSVVFNQDLNNHRFYLPSTFPREPICYDRDKLLFKGDLMRNTFTVQEIHPEPSDTQAPWLGEKGSLALCQKQNAKTTSWKEWKSVPTHQYRPLSTRSLHRRFASLKTESLETEVLRFANKYGLLGQTVLLVAPPGQSSGTVQGESSDRWRGEIEKMGVLLTIWDLIHRQEAGKLGQIIIWRNENCVELRLKWQCQNGQYEISKWDGQKKVAGFGHISEIVANREWHPDFFNEYKRRDFIGPAWYYLGAKINNHLYGIRPKLVGYHEYEVTYVPRTLLDALWLLFMLEVNGKTRTERCKYCGEWFDLDRSSKTYCNGNCRRLACYHRKKSEAKGGTK